MSYRLRMLLMTSLTASRHNGDVTLFFFKMLFLRQFLSELDLALTKHLLYDMSAWSSR